MIHSGITLEYHTIQIFKKLEKTTDKKREEYLRKELFFLLNDRFKSLKVYKLRQLHFHTKENKSFLRFLQPNLYGDDLSQSREMVVYVNRYRQPISGFESGKLCTGFRFVYPILDHEKNLLGSVELSFGADALLGSIMKQYDVLSNLFISKKIVDAKSLECRKKWYKKSHAEGFYYDVNVLKLLKQKSHMQIEKMIPSESTKKYQLTHLLRGEATVVYDSSMKMILIAIPLKNPVTGKVSAFISMRTQTDLIRDMDKHFYVTYALGSFIVIMLLVILYLQQLRKDLLTYKAHYDSLTNTYNRNKFNEVFKEEREDALRYNRPLSLLVIDIDNFKKINDSYGHTMGDVVLIELVKVIRNSIRKEDFFARWGGEEFVILLANTPLENAKKAAEHLRKTIEKTDIMNLKVTMSVGVSQLSINDTQETLFKRCDEALYMAKKEGKNRVKFK